jgi:hypothetical protein
VDGELMEDVNTFGRPKLSLEQETFTWMGNGLHVWIGRDSDGESWLTAAEARALRDWLVANVRD